MRQNEVTVHDSLFNPLNPETDNESFLSVERTFINQSKNIYSDYTRFRHEFRMDVDK